MLLPEQWLFSELISFEKIWIDISHDTGILNRNTCQKSFKYECNERFISLGVRFEGENVTEKLSSYSQHSSRLTYFSSITLWARAVRFLNSWNTWLCLFARLSSCNEISTAHFNNDPLWTTVELRFLEHWYLE